MTEQQALQPRPFFLYRTPHLIGSCAVLVGLALYFTGIVDRGWWAILVGLYIGGYLIGKGFSSDEAAQVGITLDEARVMHEVDKLIRTARPRLPQAAQAHLDSILERAATLIPMLDDLAARGVIGERVRHDILTGLTRYLPDTLGSFLALPPAYLKLHQSGPQAPVAMLCDQLKLIDDHLAKSLDEAFGEHAAELAVQGRFLAEKMGTGELPS